MKLPLYGGTNAHPDGVAARTQSRRGDTDMGPGSTDAAQPRRYGVGDAHAGEAAAPKQWCRGGTGGHLDEVDAAERRCRGDVDPDSGSVDRAQPRHHGDRGVRAGAVTVVGLCGDGDTDWRPEEVGTSALRHHGDVDVLPGMLDFAVNVQGAAPPGWLRARLAARLETLGSYPGESEDLAAREVVAARHGRTPSEVLLLAGAAEGFAILPKLAPRSAAVIHPSFTEPELALREAGVPVVRVVLPEPYTLDPALVPEDADLVVLGNPTNPTSVLHPAETIRALRRPGRIVVVDEAFADAVPGETESLAAQSFPDVLVLRSLTKTWALAGLRCGYLLGPPDLLAGLRHGRAHWPLGTLQLEAIAATGDPAAVAESQSAAAHIGANRDAMIPRLRALGIAVHEPARGPFLLIRVPDAELLRKRLAGVGIAVRRGDTFPGLGPGHLRLAVRPESEVDRLIDALREVGI